MASCDATDLVEASKCYCGLTQQTGQLAELVILCRWLQVLNPMATCSAEELLQDAVASGFIKLTAEQRAIVRLQLLCEILQAGGGGGNSCLLCDTSDPVDPPDCECALFFNRTTGRFWYWDADLVIWVLFLG